MDLSKFKELKDIKELLDLMGSYDLTELELEGGGRKIRLKKAEPQPAREIVGYAPPPGVLPASVLPAGAAGADGAAAVGEPAADDTGPPCYEVTSPLVGSFYRAPSPEAEPFVREGDRVEPDTVLCIIEAMKVMNEIRATAAGVVREILVKNADAVEYGQPLFRIETE